MLDWLRTHETLLWWLLAASAVTFVATLILVPLVIILLPSDYFADRKRHKTPWADQHPLIRWLLIAAKNLLGGVFVLAGIAMLVLPGQGLLTIAIGMMLLDFPGKYKLERWLISRRPVIRSMNWLRRRACQPPFVLGEDTTDC